MTFLPIVGRELRVSARRRGTYWIRAVFALTMLLGGVWLFLVSLDEPSHVVSLMMFAVLTGSAVLFSLLTGVRSTSDCLSREKREGTFGLLFLTDLRGYDVVLGKLAASSLNSLYGVVAVMPILAVPMLMGGVAPAEFGRMALVALNTLFFSLSIGVCVSALCRSSRTAATTTFFLIVFFAGCLPALAGWAEFHKWPRNWQRLPLLASPGYTFYRGFDEISKSGRNIFWHSLATVHAIGWVFLLGAIVVAPHTWQDRPEGRQRLRLRERWKLWSLGSLQHRLAFRRRLLDSNPLFWLIARERLKPAVVWAFLGVLGCIWFWGRLTWRDDWMEEAVCVLTGIVLNVLIKFWVAIESGRKLAEQRDEGALELLLATPLRIRDILRGQLLALRNQFLGPVLVVLGVFALFLHRTLTNPGWSSDREVASWFWTTAMAMMMLDLAALYWVGMWRGLTARSPQAAAGSSILRVLVLPWVGVALVGVIIAVWMVVRPNHTWEPEIGFFIGVWFTFGTLVDVVAIVSARHKLLTQFREAATRRYARRKRWWKKGTD